MAAKNELEKKIMGMHFCWHPLHVGIINPESAGECILGGARCKYYKFRADLEYSSKNTEQKLPCGLVDYNQ